MYAYSQCYRRYRHEAMKEKLLAPVIVSVIERQRSTPDGLYQD